jgi:hypothetical protein
LMTVSLDSDHFISKPCKLQSDIIIGKVAQFFFGSTFVHRLGSNADTQWKTLFKVNTPVMILTT